MYLRLPWIRAKYIKELKQQKANDCFICNNLKPEEIITDFGDFLVIKNKYPYMVFSEHLLITPKAHIYEITGDLKNRVNDVIHLGYEKTHWAFMNIPKNRSVYHAHWHLVKIRGGWLITLMYKIWSKIPWTTKFE